MCTSGLGGVLGRLFLQSTSEGLPVLALAANPTVTATAGQIRQFGIYSGVLYLHITAAADTNWISLTSVKALAAKVTELTALADDSTRILSLSGVTEWLYPLAAISSALQALGDAGVALPLLALAPNEAALNSLVPVAADLVAGSLVHLTADPRVTPPATNYRAGVVGYHAAADTFYLKISKTNVADAPGVAGSWYHFEELLQILSDYNKYPDDTYAGGPLWGWLNAMYHNGGTAFAKSMMDAIHYGSWANLVFSQILTVHITQIQALGVTGLTTFTMPLNIGAAGALLYPITAQARIATPFAGAGLATCTIEFGYDPGHAVDAICKAIDGMTAGASQAYGSERLSQEIDPTTTTASLTITVTGTTLDLLTDGLVDLVWQYNIFPV